MTQLRLERFMLQMMDEIHFLYLFADKNFQETEVMWNVS